MPSRKRRLYRYSFDSRWNFLGATKANTAALLVRRGFALMVIGIISCFLITKGCRLVQSSRPSRPSSSTLP